MTLLGADGPNASHDIDAYFLTELFEFALSTKQNGAVSLPFLQGYKLMHAWWLADLGLLNLAQRYCESIASAVKGYTKGSPYLHRQLLESIREFNEVCEVASGHSLGYVYTIWDEKGCLLTHVIYLLVVILDHGSRTSYPRIRWIHYGVHWKANSTSL